MRCLASTVSLVPLLVGLLAPAHADRDVDPEVSLIGIEFEKNLPGDDAKKKLGFPKPPGGTYDEYRYAPYCRADRISGDETGTCPPCPPGEGERHALEKRRVVDGVPQGDWESDGLVCLTPDDVADIDGRAITPGVVMTQLRELSWPAAVLHVQPPGGQTLVNRATFAFVDDPGPVVKTVTVLGQQVEVEGTPSSWTWHWGDGVVDETSVPGGPYPDGEVRHTYVTAHVTVQVRVDVTYAGRFQVDGGAWQELPEPHTVTGVPQPLRVSEAIPQLVP